MRNEAWNYLYLHQRIARLFKYILIEQWPFWVWFAFIWAVALSEAWHE